VSDNVIDHVVRPTVYVWQRRWSAFHVCGVAGLTFATLLTMGLVLCRGLNLGVMLALTLTAVGIFLGLAMLAKIIGGEEQLVSYHHEITILVAGAVVLYQLHQPVLPYLDITVLGIGLFRACGRVGCLMVGCCFGRPWRWGVRYRSEHAAAGFAPYYVGVRLFPVQAVEALWSLGIVCSGVVFVLTGHAPGTALAWSVVVYGLGRFAFEFARGDPARPYLWGFSQAQWISLSLLCLVVLAESGAILPFHAWHVGALTGMLLTLIAVVSYRHLRNTASHELLHPRHVKEVAEALTSVSPLATGDTLVSRQTAPVRPYCGLTDIHVRETSLGVRISASHFTSPAGHLEHYALSSQGEMTQEAANVLARLILQLKHATGSGAVLRGSRGVFHLFIRPLASEV
jgi:hypothetical protein